MEAGFELDARLRSDTMPIGDLPLSAVLLMNDIRFPWLILVPRRAGVTEITDLSDPDAAALMSEMRLAVRVMEKLSGPDKINVGALGNVVGQLHVHVVGRFRSDPAWPGAMWGFGDAVPYPAHTAAEITERTSALFASA